MCGIAGFIHRKAERSDDALLHIARQMGDAIRHRGPDDHGEWSDAQCGIGLSHRRLSIIDLSKEGHQPMHSSSERYVIVFNGEIYNFLDIKKQLCVNWRGHSDTEVMLAAIEHWGIEKALQQFNGMFAFALWDKQEKTLTLARDRMGEKPLYYGAQQGDFMFASELSALKQHPSWEGGIERQSLSLLVKYNYIPAPSSIYENISKLEPAHYLTFNTDGAIDKKCYWDSEAVASKGIIQPFKLGDKALLERLDEKLQRAMTLRMVSDVPLGAFLSGGIDSSIVVAYMQAASAHPVRTFSIGFDVEGYDEAHYAKAVAKHLGTSHTELYVTPQDALDVIPQLPHLYDEPFADSSQIPTFLVSKMAREHVTVALSGDGGDELFGGYNRYMWVENIWKKIGCLPAPLRGVLANMLQVIPVNMWNATLNKLLLLAPSRFRFSRPGDKLHKMAGLLAQRSPDDMYDYLISMWQQPSDVVKHDLSTRVDKKLPDIFASASIAERMMYQDMVGYLPDDILTKVDRAAMGVGLETRVPLLDHELVEFAWQLPMHSKIRDGKGKSLLREALYQHVPKELIERPKAGFAVPIDHWLRHDLRDWAEVLLDESRLQQEGFFHPKLIRKYWQEHLSGARNWQYHLWGVLMFQAWKEKQHD